MLPTAPVRLPPEDEAELARLELLVRSVRLPSPDLPGWQSMAAGRYAGAVRRLEVLLDEVVTAIAATRASS